MKWRYFAKHLVHAVKRCDVFRRASCGSVLLHIAADQPLVARYAVKRHGLLPLELTSSIRRTVCSSACQMRSRPERNAPEFIGSSSIRSDRLHGRTLHIGPLQIVLAGRQMG